MFAFKRNSVLSFWLTNSLLCFLAVNWDAEVAHELLIYLLIDRRLEELPITELPFTGVALCLHFPIYSFLQISIVLAWLVVGLLALLPLICLPALAHAYCAQQCSDASFKLSEPNWHYHVCTLCSCSYLETARLPPLTGRRLQWAAKSQTR